MRCVSDIASLEPRPDLVIHTGDMAQDGAIAEYEHFRQILSPLDVPVYLTPGNRDQRDAFRTVFHDRGYLPAAGEFLHYVIDDQPVRLVALDTVRPGDRRGGLCRDRLGWLDSVLTRGGDKPTVLFMHHPPFDGTEDYPDSFRDRGEAEALSEMVGRHATIVRILCGHLHRPLDIEIGSTVASTMQSVAVDLSQDPERSSDAPIYHIHQMTPDAGLVTKRRLVPS